MRKRFSTQPAQALLTTTMSPPNAPSAPAPKGTETVADSLVAPVLPSAAKDDEHLNLRGESKDDEISIKLR